LGTLAGVWRWPSLVLHGAGRAETAAIAAGASVAVNNLPAAVLLATRPIAHPGALLLGLNVGPNLAVTGSLSAIIWYRAARTAGARPSIRTYSLLGVLIVPLSIAAGLAATWAAHVGSW